MAGFTPGPWNVDEQYCVNDINGNLLAEPVGENYVADAALIAAAPYLYEACREFMQKFVDEMRFYGPTVDKIKAALDKADGKEVMK